MATNEKTQLEEHVVRNNKHWKQPRERTQSEAFVICNSQKHFIDKLESFAQRDEVPGVWTGR